MISTSAPRRVVKLVAKGGIITTGSTSPQHCDQLPSVTTATDEVRYYLRHETLRVVLSKYKATMLLCRQQA